MDWIAIIPDQLNVADVQQFLTDSTAGGMDIFVGATRCETSVDGKQLVHLNYEAYREMALVQMQQLADSARNNWPIVKLVILHRIGVVKVGEPSVVIGVSTAHRAAAFEACRYLIDQLKAVVPIWKSEGWNDGSSSWVAGTAIKK